MNTQARRVVAHLGKGCFLSTEVSGAAEVNRAKETLLRLCAPEPIKAITVQPLVAHRTLTEDSEKDNPILLPEWGSKKIIWPKKLIKAPALTDQRKVTIIWMDDTKTQKDFYPGFFQNIHPFVQKIIDEHANPSPHSGILAVKKICLQYLTSSGWSKQEILWPLQ